MPLPDDNHRHKRNKHRESQRKKEQPPLNHGKVPVVRLRRGRIGEEHRESQTGKWGADNDEDRPDDPQIYKPQLGDRPSDREGSGVLVFLSLSDGREDPECDECCAADGEAGVCRLDHSGVGGVGVGFVGVSVAGAVVGVAYAHEESAEGDEGEGED